MFGDWLRPFFVALLLQRKYDEADALFARAISVMEKAVGPDHQEMIHMLYQRALLLDAQVNSRVNLIM